MEFNFDATNNLIDLLNKHVMSTAPLQHVHVHHNASVEKNADMLISRMDDIQDVIDNIDKKLAEELDPDLYKELNDPNLSFKQRIALCQESLFSDYCGRFICGWSCFGWINQNWSHC